MESAQSYQSETVNPPAWYDILKWQGRMGRLNFTNAFVIMSTVTVIPMYASYIAFAEFAERDNSSLALICLLVSIIFALVHLVYVARYMALRLHDLNAAGGWGVLLAIGYIFTSGVPIICLMALPGTTGENRFGLPSRTGSKAGLIVMIASTALVIVVGVAFFVLMTFH